MKPSLISVLLLGATVVSGCCREVATADYNVVPLPREIELRLGEPVRVSSNTAIVYTQGDDTLRRTAEFLAGYIEQSTGVKLKTTDKPHQGNAIELHVVPGIAESYTLTVGPKGVVIEGGDRAGVFYGVQTLRKSIPAGAKGCKLLLPQAVVRDAPRFGYRGMHLDAARHFFTVDSVKRYVDMLALHNINRFHWHLTDDQGWRIEIDRYPKLAEIGAWRRETLIGHYTDQPVRYDNTRYGGHYTKEEMRDVVCYAAERFITVVPEVELPGHALAALSAYPELGCTGGPYEAATTWGVFDEIFCAGNQKTIKFLEDVLDEVTEIFPSRYIHIGGDEAPKMRWAACPRCQAKIRELGIKGTEQHTAENQLQSWVVARMAAHLATKGRAVIGWDEILEGGLSGDATVMSWRGTEGGVEAAKLGHDAVMTPVSHCYFDYYQAEDHSAEPVAIGGYLPLEKVYGYEPMSVELTAERRSRIIGVQANLWTEYISTYRHVEYMALPRMAALCEVQWRIGDTKDYADFLARLPRMLAVYDAMEYNYRREKGK
jgi:hexosaminidase